MKRELLKRKSKSKISLLKRKLWKVFSEYIRKRDDYTCFTCGRKAKGSGMHAGHFISKQIGGIALYFHEDNVHAQCYNCNINLGGNHYIFGLKLGKEKCDELYGIKNKYTEKWTEDDYLNKIEYYTSLIV
jgi:hypothetical protein